ncbi:ABC transporter permease [Flavobacterium gawalongense]|uniref:ABC transporter permease n=1 Tax=Flavobacterium gawalongense TaxID=2594432 RepID=A0A553BDY6_9FLAO|nr:FtsX-like permease family protein [Flavobacterium gawalongense]TRW98921.1 ABC transporter permease [Flavobacterium gawalongense]TRX03494.1 ABC transporter permease [Flavobacterium gawalongense]TRX06457.1 ABC transporter permease [Flavobacterium gawalongense]TRX07282.1 ABC transporter permease [Flavobacterium gawalongense]TRX25014.1 ABC transporter permease [Flavobacterium gawalongense]
MILKLIWRNLWRNSRRTLITMASIAFAVLFAVLMKSFQNGVFNNLIKNVVGYYSGYVQIHQNGYWDEQVLDNSFALENSLTAQLQQNPQITAIVPRLETFVLASKGNTTKGCLLVGTDAVRENNLTQLKSKLIKGTYFEKNEEAVLLAEGLSKRLDVSVNDTIVLFGQGFHGVMAAGKYKIKGIVHLASPAMNDAFVYLPLAAAQYFLSAENRLTSVSLGIDNPENTDAIVQNLKNAIGEKYEVMPWQEMMPEIANHIKADGFSFYIFSGILYLIIGFGLFGTVLMMTAERKYEFGMLIAIGMKKTKLELILLGETLLITFFGVLLGFLLSLPLVIYLKERPIRFGGEIAKVYEQFGFEALFPTDVDQSIFLTQSLIVLAMAIVIGLYPLWHVRGLDPVKAMKK